MGVTVVKGRLMQTAAVSAFSGCGSVLTTDRRAPESSLFFFLPRFISPTPSLCALPVSHPRAAILFLASLVLLNSPDVAIATL